MDAASSLEANAYFVVLLGGEAGLRCGEMLALRWNDINWATGQLTVKRSVWKGHVTATKGGRVRYVPLPDRLREALQMHRHLRGSHVLAGKDGRPLTQKMVQSLVKWAARRAGVTHGVHILRQTYCSHLAMRGVSARSIQELAGHQNLATTQRYMHLTPATLEAAGVEPLVFSCWV